jgi:hypothetical protein
MSQGREIRNSGLNIVVSGNTGLKAWDRTNLGTAALLWNSAASVFGLACKSTTTWFLTGRGSG